MSLAPFDYRPLLQDIYTQLKRIADVLELAQENPNYPIHIKESKGGL